MAWTSTLRWGTAWAPSMRTSAPASWALRVISSTGLIVPSVLLTWVNATSLGLSRSRTSYTSWRRIPSSVIGMNSRSASFSWARICHGTRFAWCSISVSTIASPRSMCLRPQLYATRLIDSVALRVQMMVVRVGRVDQPRDLDPRALVGGGRPLAQRVDPAMDVRVVLAVVGVERLEDRGRLLGGRRRVQVDQPMAVDLLVEDREVGAQRLGIEGSRLRDASRPSSRDSYRLAPATSGSRGTASASSGRLVSMPFSRRIGP